MIEATDPRLEGHVMETREAKSWRLSSPDRKSFYWFHVTWSPGVLALSGDWGEITAIHYQAMKTWQEAAYWMHGACYRYFMEKTHVREEYDSDATLEQWIHTADEYIEGWSDYQFWEKLGKLEYRYGTDLHLHAQGYPRSKRWRTRVAESLKGMEITGEDWYDVFEDCEVLSYAYPFENEMKWKALSLWAKRVVEGLEATKEKT